MAKRADSLSGGFPALAGVLCWRWHGEYAANPPWVPPARHGETARIWASSAGGEAAGASGFPNGTRLDDDRLTCEWNPPGDPACPSDQLSPLLRFTARL